MAATGEDRFATRPGAPDWHSRVEAPLRLAEGEAAGWDECADVVIVGLGGAGICAAIEALDAGASVIAIDRFDGGGATRLSGGVFYAGGGTRHQREAGVADDPEEMFRYLRQEVGDAISGPALRAVCRSSSGQLDWLERNGVPFASALSPVKTSYPAEGCFLYHSGNEAQADYADHAKPAQRGHRTFGKGMTGRVFFDALLQTALHKGLKVLGFSEARRLVVASDGRIVGVEVWQVSPGGRAARRLKAMSERFARTDTLLFPAIAERLVRRANALVDRHGTARIVGARRGVILATGGYIHNRAMVRSYAPRFSGAIALGSIGCDGSGIRLGQTVGARAERLENISAWRQFQPPAAFACGIVVNALGERFIAEDCYGGTIGNAIADQPGGKAWIVIDAALRRRAFREALPGRGKLFRLQGAPALMGLLLTSRRGRTLAELARRCGMDPALLESAVAEYNVPAQGAKAPAFRKAADFTARLMKPPYHAVDISIDNTLYLCPSISLGGLAVDEAMGAVLDAQGQVIVGLYAAGKCASGLSSNRYVSGLSLADCVHSGRMAGRSAAGDSEALLSAGS